MLPAPPEPGGRLTSRKWPRWLTPNVDSNPSAVAVGWAPDCTPAWFHAVLARELVRATEDVAWPPDDLPGYAGAYVNFGMASRRHCG